MDQRHCHGVSETRANELKIGPMQTETHSDQANWGLEYRQKYVVAPGWPLAEMTHEQEGAEKVHDAIAAAVGAEAVQYDENLVRDLRYR